MTAHVFFRRNDAFLDFADISDDLYDGRGKLKNSPAVEAAPEVNFNSDYFPRARRREIWWGDGAVAVTPARNMTSALRADEAEEATGNVTAASGLSRGPTAVDDEMTDAKKEANIYRRTLACVDWGRWLAWIQDVGLRGSRMLACVDPGCWLAWIQDVGLRGFRTLACVDSGRWP